MCNAFEKYLETFRRTVIFVADTSIVQLSLRLAPLVKQMRNLAKVLSIHPSGRADFHTYCFVHHLQQLKPITFQFHVPDLNSDIPSGSKFLGHLYQLATTVGQKDVSLLLLYVLTECCDIYFR